MKTFLLKISYLFVMVAVLFGSLLPTINAQASPIKISSLGENVDIESITVSSSVLNPSIYVTGRIGYNTPSVHFSPYCGDDVDVDMADCTGVFDYKFFVASLFLDPGGNHYVNWMVVGASDASYTDENSLTGKDIEVDAAGNIYVTGTLKGNVGFTQIYPATCPYNITACGSDDTRHCILKIDNSGTPLWVAESRTPPGIESYGEGLTLDEGNGRLFTTGYISTHYAPGGISFKDASCADRCNFTYTAPAIAETGNLGFVAEYTLDGINKRATQIGAKVMDITMDGTNSNYQWITGSRDNGGDSYVLLAAMKSIPLAPWDFCDDAYIDIKPTGGIGKDIGLDIDYTSDNKVVLTGAYSRACMLGTFLPFLPSGLSDLFVAVYDEGTMSFTGQDALGAISPIWYEKRTSCVDAKGFGDKFIIGYDVDGLNILTKEFNTSLGLIATDNISLISSSGSISAKEIQYSLFMGNDDRFLAGNYSGKYIFGPCAMVSGGNQEGYIARLNSSHAVYLTDNTGNETTQVYHENMIFPNPSQGKVTINYTLEAETLSVSLQLYDLRGQEVYQKYLSGYQGLNETNLDFNLPNGTYMLKVNADGQSILSEKLVLLK